MFIRGELVLYPIAGVHLYRGTLLGSQDKSVDLPYTQSQTVGVSIGALYDQALLSTLNTGLLDQVGHGL